MVQATNIGAIRQRFGARSVQPKFTSHVLYQIVLSETHLQRCGATVMTVQMFDLTHVFDVTSPAPSRVT
jgi:hypothetical protein